jgi:hypothetical protein
MAVVAMAGSVSNQFTFNPSGTSNQWATFTLDFTATAGTTDVTLVGKVSGGGAYLGLDQISVVPLGPRLKIAAAEPGQATVSWKPATPGFVLQETWTLPPANWTNSPSGTTNPIPVPATGPTRFYRLFKP